MGKIGRAFLRPLYKFANAIETPHRLSPAVRKSLLWRSSILPKLSPRTIHRTSSSSDALIYTDAAGSGGCAALVFSLNSDDARPLLLQGRASEDDRARAAGANLIFALELYSVVAALFVIARSLEGKNLVFLVDNDAASQALINGASNRDLANRLIGVFWLLAGEFSLNIWLERVASASNPADAPSRGNPPEMACRATQKLPPLGSLLARFESFFSAVTRQGSQK